MLRFLGVKKWIFFKAGKEQWMRFFQMAKILILAITTLVQVKVYAQENLGVFRFSEFSLKPLLHLQEESGSAFQIQATYLGFEWRRDENLRGQMLLGSSDLIQPAVWFSPVTEPAFGIVEAYLEGRSIYGDFRAGLVNLQMGYEGAMPEWAWVLPPTHFHQQAWMIARDFGFQFHFTTYPFTTMFTISNGETTTNNPNNKFWYSSLFELKNSEGLGILFTAQVGQTTTAATGGSNPTLAQSKYGFAFNPNLDAKIRVGSISFFQDDGRSLYLLEGGSGDILQSSTINSFAFGHIDFAIRLVGDLNLLLRYEQDQTNMSDYTTVTKSSSLGFMLTSKDKLQSFTMMGTVNQLVSQYPDNELQLIFRLNSRNSN